MTPQELKNSILQLAIQGKLVEQRPEDQPVDVSRLKMKKTDESEFDLPNKWIIAHLESISKPIPTKQYQVLESEVKKEGLFPVISQSKEYSIGYTDESNKVFCHSTPVIVFGDHTTEVKYVSFDFVIGADGVKIFEPLCKIIESKYLYYIFLYNCINLNKVGGYSRHYKYIKDKPIPLPPLAEQKRIVAKIEELLPLIDRYEQAWTRLEALNKRFPEDMQKSLLQFAIQGKLVEQRPEEGTAAELYRQIQREKQALIKAGKLKKEKPLPDITEDEKPFEIPEGWMWVRIGKVFNLQAGKNITSAHIYKEVSPEHQYPCYGGNGCRGYVASYNRTGHYALIGRQGALCGNINYANGNFYATEHAVVVEQYADTDIKWCGYFLKALNLNQYATATAQPGLAVANINQVLIPLPPLAEQKRIVARLEELLPLCKEFP